MSDKELDEILAEIKQRASERDGESSPFKPEPPKEQEKPIEFKMPEVKAEEPELTFEEPQEAAPAAESPIEELIEEPVQEAAPAAEENVVEEIDKAFEEIKAPAEEAPLGINDDNIITNHDAPEEYFDEPAEDGGNGGGKSRKPLVIIISIVVLLAIVIGVYFGVIAKKDNDAPTTAPPATEVMTKDKKRGALNPLTGEEGYNEEALTKRPVAVVVENEYSTESVRPQWGLNEADIVLEGESEYSTRMLLFWADYTDVPSQVGPTRSARPPFIRFSQLFDSIFIHAGLSHSKGNYTGADSVFESDGVDHINLLKYSEDGKYFGRDNSRRTAVEHTGYLNGDNLVELIESTGFNTEINTSKFSILEFNKKPEKLSDKAATSVSFTWSDIYSSGKCPKIGKYYYDEEKEKYTTNDFDSSYGEAELEFENLIFLLDETEYVVKENYKGSGNSETYCNYNLSGGEGMILSQGTALEIKWSVKDGKLVFETADGDEVKLNPGKSYIGYGSSNHGGAITINPETEN